jgi:potassium channel subfamily K
MPTSTNQAAASELHARAQDHLEALPNHVLHQVKSFHQHIRFFVDGGGGSGMGMRHRMDDVSESLRRLLDEIASLGGIGRVTKEEILQDEDARHVS